MEAEIRFIVTVGITLAKNVFAAHGADGFGRTVCMMTPKLMAPYRMGGKPL